MTKRELLALIEDYHPNEVVKLVIKDSRDNCSLLPIEIVGVNTELTQQTGFLTLDLDYSFATDTAVETEADKLRRDKMRQDAEVRIARMKSSGWEDSIKQIVVVDRPATPQEQGASIENIETVTKIHELSEFIKDKPEVAKEEKKRKKTKKWGAYKVPKNMESYKRKRID